MPSSKQSERVLGAESPRPARGLPLAGTLGAPHRGAPSLGWRVARSSRRPSYPHKYSEHLLGRRDTVAASCFAALRGCYAESCEALPAGGAKQDRCATHPAAAHPLAPRPTLDSRAGRAGVGRSKVCRSASGHGAHRRDGNFWEAAHHGPALSVRPWCDGRASARHKRPRPRWGRGPRLCEPHPGAAGECPAGPQSPSGATVIGRL